MRIETTHYRVTKEGEYKKLIKGTSVSRKYIKDEWLCGNRNKIDQTEIKRRSTTNPRFVTCSLCKRSRLFTAIPKHRRG